MSSPRIIECQTSFEKIVDELYDPKKMGAMTIFPFLEYQIRQEARKEIARAKDKFTKGETTYKNAVQDLSYIDLSTKDTELPITQEIWRAYNEWYQELAAVAKFPEPLDVNVATLLKYNVGSRGLSMHRDNSHYRNILASLIIEGDALFSVGRTRNDEHPMIIDPWPGEVIFMRAPRAPEEQDLRPYHSVGDVTNLRIALLLRQQKNQ